VRHPNYFLKLKKMLLEYLDRQEVARIREAYIWANKAHSGQQRQSGEPYITHPVAVSEILADLHLDADTIIAALLHDTIEDTGITKAEIMERFGESVATLVDGVSKLTHIKFASKAEAQAENFRRMLLAMAKDLRVILVKLADRLHNMHTLDVVSPEKRRRIARETLEIYIPLASRLGMHKWRVELEELCFSALYPQRARVLRESVCKMRGNRKQIVRVIEQALALECQRHNLKNFEIIGREKHLYSIYRKMLERQLSLTEIMDVYAFRITVDTIEDCYRMLGYVHNLYKPVSERFKDFIAIPKANGYQSLHTTLFGPYGVPIEIQIRTREMHKLAENGIAAHWLYKSDEPFQDSEARVRAQVWVNELVEMQSSASSSTEFIETVKTHLFPDEVYVFTPKGKIFALPQGATAIDFAYAIHTDIGNHTVAAKIDRHYSLLSTPLANGQTIEIITAPTAHPSPSWLDFATTGKAQNTIRQYFKRQRNTELNTMGEKLLTKALETLDLQLNEIPSVVINEVVTKSSYGSLNQMLESIGAGHDSAAFLAEMLQATLHNLQTEKVADELEPLPIHGMRGISVQMAECCHPIPGDAIVGDLGNDSLAVHRYDCAKVTGLHNDPKKFILLHWQMNVEKDYQVPLEIRVKMDRGILNRVIMTLDQAGSIIEDLFTNKIEYGEQVFVFLILVKNLQHLEKIISRLEALKDILKVMRLRSPHDRAR
jgi:guanosine-3',5'-bis(diphosphate) 3'-pyrophosphohydrolase